ncbi:threonylcarbamoyl-AMP synthase [Xylanibacillus composti]|nr:L-threonylcarbamoyladenylate synthase [Xylanibacillus composti]MDT9726006.1 threonylcarbamoyl-AMP synthase [Xylanibacillus composti]
MQLDNGAGLIPPTEEGLREAGRLLREGEVVAFPTETVYGLGADARSSSAVEKVYAAKGRPSDNPLIVHIAELDQLAAIAEPPDDVSARLMAHFWPGPLTVVLPAKSGALSPLVTAGLATVAVRMPDHPLARRLIAAAGCPLAAPSANRSGRPSPTRAEHVAHDLAGRIAGVVNGGPTGVGLESTVVEVNDGCVYVLRPGGISAEQLREVHPRVETVAPETAEHAAAPRSPGMKYAHYAPQGELTLVAGPPKQTAAYIWKAAAEAAAQGKRVGLLTYAEHADVYASFPGLVQVCGSLADPASTARGLYESLRAFDEQAAEQIYAEAYPEHGLGAAIMNRLRKAAAGRVLTIG